MIDRLCDDLEAEHEALDALVADLDTEGWSTPTLAEGWVIRDQISHLAYFDGSAQAALVDPAGFEQHARELVNKLERGAGIGDTGLGRSVSGNELVGRWRAGRAQLVEAARRADPSLRVPWYAQPMSLASFVTARLMETWAHGQDVVDALGAEPVVTDRLRHVCELGVRARPFSFLVNRRQDPGGPVHVDLATPGTRWRWGPEDAADRISGHAFDFALLVTRRRHRADTDLVVEGPTARAWMEIAQAFAGPPGPGRAPGLRRAPT